MGSKNDDWATLMAGFLAIFAYIAVFAAVAYGYIWNIITLFSDMDTISGVEAAVRTLGILVAPAGAIMGYF
jgi:hypothetical protein